MKKALSAALVLIFLTGCWDKVEIENRGYVITIGIDKYQGETEDKEKPVYYTGEDKVNLRYTVSAALPNISELAEKGSGGEGRATDGDSSPKAKSVKKAASGTVFGAMNLLDAYSSQKLYYGQTKLCVVGEALLKDPEAFAEAIDSLERNNELGKRIILLATKGEASEILNADVSGEPLVGMFVSNFYKNNKYSINGTLRRDLDMVTQQLALSGNTVIPEISIDNGEIKLGGLAVIKQYELAGWLSDMETRGYLWIQKPKIGGVLTVPYENTHVPLMISGKTTKIFFREAEEALICYIDVKIDGTVEEYTRSSLNHEASKHLERAYEDGVRNEIIKTAEIFQNRFSVDGLGFEDKLRKDNYGLYLKYKDNFENVFQEITIEPVVKVSIKNTGM